MLDYSLKYHNKDTFVRIIKDYGYINKGRMQIPVNRKLHFNPVPYRKESRSWISKSLLIHLGYLDNSKRMNKYNFYQQEDRSKILSYGDILCNECQLEHVQNITIADFEV